MSRLVALAVLAACQTREPPPPAESPKVELPAVRARTTMSSSAAAHEPAPPPAVTVAGLVAEGQHWRVESAHGPIHVWIPHAYNARRAETIVYVHGFYTHVDEAWQSHQLAAQFASSAINAMFIACEAPGDGREPVAWDSLTALLDAVEHGIGQPHPRRRIVVVGHSGAWRTMGGWLDEPLLDTVVLLDAAYTDVAPYRDWVLASPKHRLIDIGDDTRAATDQLHKSLPESVVLDGFPPTDRELPREITRARILYIRSSIGHFPLVTGGIAMPIVLRTLTGRRLLATPLDELLESR